MHLHVSRLNLKAQDWKIIFIKHLSPHVCSLVLLCNRMTEKYSSQPMTNTRSMSQVDWVWPKIKACCFMWKEHLTYPRSWKPDWQYEVSSNSLTHFFSLCLTKRCQKLTSKLPHHRFELFQSVAFLNVTARAPARAKHHWKFVQSLLTVEGLSLTLDYSREFFTWIIGW